MVFVGLRWFFKRIFRMVLNEFVFNACLIGFKMVLVVFRISKIVFGGFRDEKSTL